jgi:DNA transformation protein and related proteins
LPFVILGSGSSFRLRAAQSQPHSTGYDVLVMGLQARPWNDCKGDEKRALRERFDAIKPGAVTRQAEWDKAMDFFGVVDRA